MVLIVINIISIIIFIIIRIIILFSYNVFLENPLHFHWLHLIPHAYFVNHKTINKTLSL